MFGFIVKWSVYTIYSIAICFFFQFLNASYFISNAKDWYFNDITNDEIYDYIIVGAGSAGITIASRLIDAKNKVLLIEAGGPPPYFANIPILAPLLQHSPYDWQYKTIPQYHACKGLINNQSRWPMGKILGGSSRLNYMAYIKGHPADYYEWFPDYDSYDINNVHNSIVNDLKWCSELCDTISASVVELSQRTKYRNDHVIDFANVKLTIKNGERWSTDELLKTKRKPELNVITHAHVNKIIFNLNKAEGVEFTKWGKQFNAGAKKSVIISAGAIGTPKLLMLSGIGIKNDLKNLNIKLISDLPVGKNLMDHILTGVDLISLNTSLSLNILKLLSPKSMMDYALFREGPWTSAGIEVIGTLSDTLANKKHESPDIQFMIIPVGISQDNGVALRKFMGISDEIFSDYFAPLAYKTTITIAPVLLHPKSTGEVKLKSSNPLDEPIIDPKYLFNKDDVSTLIKGIRFVEEIVNTDAMKALGASIYTKHFPGCENFIFGSTKYWECYIRHLTLTSYHPAGTCKMGSVVDKSFRVIGTKNLHVVDASVLPKMPSANINAAVMMIAEKAADLILKKKFTMNIKKCYQIDLLKYSYFCIL
ncbi:hypothetical protein PV326_006373 [Microctonus aethiopoides]|nr:hypothetical protein PV326_006373 [Microctonus aethiopoides]